jgi:Protein of unknown function (DUF5672)
MSVARLALPDVTLCAVDTRSPALALAAMARCMANIDFGHAVLLTDAAGTAAALPAQAGAAAAVERRDIGAIRSARAYSDFVLGGLPDHVRGTHVLIVQWDGFVSDVTRWTPEFLEYDYLGAPWKQGPNDWLVGNGGFSLRSMRLMRALQTPALQAQWHHPEDVCIGQTLRATLEQAHGIRFPPNALASRFAFENQVPTQGATTFGFHGVYNWPRVLPLAALQTALAALPDDVAASRDGFKLARALLKHGHVGLAQRVIEQGAALRPATWRWRLLALRCGLKRLA